MGRGLYNVKKEKEIRKEAGKKGLAEDQLAEIHLAHQRAVHCFIIVGVPWPDLDTWNSDEKGYFAQ